MYKPGRILVFLAVCLCIVLMPVLANHGRVAALPGSALETPEISKLTEQQCIEPVEYMRANHMLLLEDWRNVVVREGFSRYESSAGQVYEMSLEDSCFSCHSNRAEFCASCHDYVGIDPNCWSCHDGGAAETDKPTGKM